MFPTTFNTLQSLPEGYRALVIGSTGAIGSAFLAHLQTGRGPGPPHQSGSRFGR